MFPRNKVTGVLGNKIQMTPSTAQNASFHKTRGSQEITANVMSSSAGTGMHSMSMNSNWASQFQYYMTGLIPAEPGMSDTTSLGLFYRDMYLFDNVCGSAVDIQSTFPFSDYDLRGLDAKELDVYSDALTQLNIPRMLPEISTAYLVDGRYCGSLVFDPRTRKFMDTLVHDALQCTVIQSPFFNMQPEIKVTPSTATMRFLGSDSPYVDAYKATIPGAFLDMMTQGSFTLNPVNTLFVARRSLTDRAYVSFLHRILPMYLIEKTMFRGTLVEAGRRQRAMSHLTAGDDLWTPTGEELQALVNEFQATEFDPLGGWVATRGSVSVTDIRPGGDFWKWTDMVDTMTPYKLRALGISESFLSGDASFASAESAVSTFLETQNSYRDHLTNAVFYSTLFPLIAVANEFYIDTSKKAKSHNVAGYLLDSSNRANLKIPRLMWHKSLEAKGEENTFEMLEQASEKGVPIPLKSWMAAAQLDSDALLKDLAEDKELRKKLEQYTGKDTSHEGEDSTTAEYAKLIKDRMTVQSSNSGARNRRALLSRNFDTEFTTTGRTGKQKWVHNARTKDRENNARLAKIAARLAVDPEYRIRLAKANMEKFGRTTIPGAGDVKKG